MRTAAAPTDTIAAIVTPAGEGGLAVLRVCGANALRIADLTFRPVGRNSTRAQDAATHTLHYGHITRNARRVDEVLLAVMRAPRTFTREDTVEISCHGGVFVAREILDALLEAGARLAEPGEFSRRAFLNGRIDLTQAEAVADVIHARTELALAAANEQLAGGLSRKIDRIRDELMATLAHLEAHIDFPDEDISPASRIQIERRLDAALSQIDELLSTAREGQVLRRGIRAAIVGRPNAGKSSLLNQLLGRDRAIVSPIPGTTRDTIEATANIRGIPVVLVDTAGLRPALDPIEEEGIRRTREAASQSELVLHVIDRSEPLAEVDRQYLAEFGGRVGILVLNKSDLPRHPGWPDTPAATWVAVSCASGAGIEDLKTAIAERVRFGGAGAGMHEVMINARHEDAMRRAHAGTTRTIAALRTGLSLELAAADLRIGVHALGEVVGKTTTEDLLDSIFSQFCLGK